MEERKAKSEAIDKEKLKEKEKKMKRKKKAGKRKYSKMWKGIIQLHTNTPKTVETIDANRRYIHIIYWIEKKNEKKNENSVKKERKKKEGLRRDSSKPAASRALLLKEQMKLLRGI